MNGLWPPLALPEWLLLGCTGSVVIRWTRTITLLLLVMPTQKDLEGCRDKEAQPAQQLS